MSEAGTLYGPRESGGGNKGRGYFGELKTRDGRVATELSITMDIGHGEEAMPLLVPTLTKKQIDHLLAGGRAGDDIIDSVYKFAIARRAAGLPYFPLKKEEATYKVPTK